MGKKLRPIDILKCLKEKSMTVDEIKNRKDYDRIIKLALREGILTQNDLIKDEVSNLSFDEFSNGKIYSIGNFIAKVLHDELKDYVDDVVSNATPAIITEEDLNSIFDSIDDDTMES